MKSTLKQIQSIFGKKDNALEYIRKFHPETFQKKTSRSRKLTFSGENPYTFIQTNWDGKRVRGWLLSFCCEREGGKFYNIHKNYKSYELYLAETIKERSVLQMDLGQKDICLPDAFSDQVVKPMIRKWIKSLATKEQRELDNKISYLKLKIHELDRVIAQMNNDKAEYDLLIACDHYVPTLKHNAGVDGYLLNKGTGSIIDLDIKTSRWPQGKTPMFGEGVNNVEAATALYANQGADRYSENPRLYLVLPSMKGELPENDLSIAEQIENSFDVSFVHSNKKIREKYGSAENGYARTVKGVRLIFMNNAFNNANTATKEYNTQEKQKELL